MFGAFQLTRHLGTIKEGEPRPWACIRRLSSDITGAKVRYVSRFHASCIKCESEMQSRFYALVISHGMNRIKTVECFREGIDVQNDKGIDANLFIFYSISG